MVSAWITSSVSSSSNPVPFDTVGANVGGMWDSNTHKFTMKAEQGVFYVAMDAGVPQYKALNFVLQKSDKPLAGCSHTYTVKYNADSTGRDIILRVNSSETLHFTSSTGLYSDRDVYTNIALFNIAELISSDKDHPVVFSVARNSMLGGIANPMIFNQILFNDFSHYDVSTNKFTAPSSGIYYFTLSVGGIGGLPVEFMLHVNGEPFTSIIRESTARKETDVIGRSIMMYLNKSDTVHVVNGEDKVAWSSKLLQTSFAGFKYKPAHGNKVSEKVHPEGITN